MKAVNIVIFAWVNELMYEQVPKVDCMNEVLRE